MRGHARHGEGSWELGGTGYTQSYPCSIPKNVQCGSYKGDHVMSKNQTDIDTQQQDEYSFEYRIVKTDKTYAVQEVTFRYGVPIEVVPCNYDNNYLYATTQKELQSLLRNIARRQPVEVCCSLISKVDKVTGAA